MRKPILSLAEQVKIEESLQPEIETFASSPEFCHYLATHPKAYQEFKEALEDIRRMTRFCA